MHVRIHTYVYICVYIIKSKENCGIAHLASVFECIT